MAKAKTPGGSVPNRPLYSRISFLYQAATYLGTRDDQRAPTQTTQETKNSCTESEEKYSGLKGHAAQQALSRRFLTDLRSTSLKSQIRLSPAMKHTICKLCDSLLIEGETSSSTIENRSKGGRKPWADVLVVKCSTCGGVRRYPVQATRQKRRSAREEQEAKKATGQRGKNTAEIQDEEADVMMEEG
ncbi:Rpr2-domain-containing protein [Biscogniauxia mediterranea]|nr:Rpr2-domain-containing protein [Biscogniauxia mediterranea]